MKWGVALNVREGVSESLRKAVIADQGGIDQIWVTDFPSARYAPAVATAIAERTKSCRIGVGLVSPLLYSSTQIVQFMSTLADSYGERFDLLLGPGDKLALANIGVSYSSKLMVDKTTRALEEIKQRLSEAGHSCSVLLGAQGPIMIKASVKADGALFNYSDLELAEWALNQIKNEVPAGFQLGVFPPTYVGDCQDIATNESISYSAAMVAIGLSRVVSESFGFHDRLQAARVLMKEHGQFNKDVVNSLGSEILRRFAFCGTGEQLRDYMKTLEKMGFGSIVFGPPQGMRNNGVEILVNAKSTYHMD
jgi:alkanesulfonate monooxygenase SsuD/methylene tetrahydromethanopterin reductase-like flavin-dependent oxidoreductase (luciferase family)